MESSKECNSQNFQQSVVKLSWFSGTGGLKEDELQTDKRDYYSHTHVCLTSNYNLALHGMQFFSSLVMMGRHSHPTIITLTERRIWQSVTRNHSISLPVYHPHIGRLTKITGHIAGNDICSGFIKYASLFSFLPEVQIAIDKKKKNMQSNW